MPSHRHSVVRKSLLHVHRTFHFQVLDLRITLRPKSALDYIIPCDTRRRVLLVSVNRMLLSELTSSFSGWSLGRTYGSEIVPVYFVRLE